MRISFKLLLGATAGVVFAMGQSSVALANGGLHVGDTHIPTIVVWIGGGAIGAFFLFFLIGWSLSIRASRLSQEGDVENKPHGTEGEKK